MLYSGFMLSAIFFMQSLSEVRDHNFPVQARLTKKDCILNLIQAQRMAADDEGQRIRN
jgi:hypothetical protein